MSARNYSSTVVARQLNAAMSSSTSGTADSLVLDSTNSLPQSYPFTLVIDPDTISEEIVTVTGAPSGSTYPITRGSDGTNPIAHANGSTVRHMITARDLQDAQNHIEATAGGYTIINDGQGNTTHSLHGIASGEGSVVGTAKTQTLTNKTISGGTLTGTITNSGTINGGTVNVSSVISTTFAAAAGGSISLAAGAALNLGGAGTITANGVTVTADKVSYLETVTSNIQTQINAKLTTPSAWTTSYTPTITGWSIGNGSVSFSYNQIGKTIHFKGRVTVGSTTTVTGGDLEISLPVAATSDLNWQGTGRANLTNLSTVLSLTIVPSSTTTFKPLLLEASGTYSTRVGIGSGVYSRVAGDVVIFNGTYEAA